jgi:hypothetical protein
MRESLFSRLNIANGSRTVPCGDGDRKEGKDTRIDPIGLRELEVNYLSRSPVSPSRPPLAMRVRATAKSRMDAGIEICSERERLGPQRVSTR